MDVGWVVPGSFVFLWELQVGICLFAGSEGFQAEGQICRSEPAFFVGSDGC